MTAAKKQQNRRAEISGELFIDAMIEKLGVKILKQQRKIELLEDMFDILTIRLRQADGDYEDFDRFAARVRKNTKRRK
jgi:uncharacterized protein YdiU (UPF0061 family)